MAAYDRPKMGNDGWTDWIQPAATGYRLACCDCGLVHVLDFRVLKNTARRGRRLVVQFRASRHERATAASRREAAKRKAKPCP